MFSTDTRPGRVPNSEITLSVAYSSTSHWLIACPRRDSLATVSHRRYCVTGLRTGPFCPENENTLIRKTSDSIYGSTIDVAQACELADLGLHGAGDRILDPSLRRSLHDGITVSIDSASRACIGIPFGPRMRAGRDVFTVHQDGRRPQVLPVRRAPWVFAVPLGPDRRDLGTSASSRQNDAREVDVRTAGVIHEFDLKLQGQFRPPCNTGQCMTRHRRPGGLAGSEQHAQRTEVP